LAEEDKGILKRILTFFAENRRVTFRASDLAVLGLDVAKLDWLQDEDIVRLVEPSERYCRDRNCTYTLGTFDFDDPDEEFASFLTMLALNSGELFYAYERLDLFLARWLYERYAGRLEFLKEGDDSSAVAWFILKSMERFEIEEDEKVDRVDYFRSNLGPTYYRLGSAWLCKRTVRRNADRWRSDYGSFIGLEFSFESPGSE